MDEKDARELIIKRMGEAVAESRGIKDREKRLEIHNRMKADVFAIVEQVKKEKENQ